MFPLIRRYFPVLLLVLIWNLWAGTALADETEPEDPEGPNAPISIVDRLAAPPMPANPTQPDYGAQVYYQVCMACHGDKGQGLTDEWREVWDEDAYCWASKCHGPSHPPHGFQFPKVTAPVVGPQTLGRFANAQELYDYNVEAMPWWNPGYLKEEEFWQVTAFLMRANGFLPEGVELNRGNAAVFRLHLIAPLPGDRRPDTLLIAAMLSLVAGLLVVQNRFNR